MKSVALFALVAAVALSQVVIADVPAHCELQQLFGVWKFFVGPTQKRAAVDNGDGTLNCDKFSVDQATRTFEVALRWRNVAVLDGNNQPQFWTPMADEGMELRVAHKDINAYFFAFFDYKTSEDETGRKISLTYCNATSAGSYHERPGKLVPNEIMPSLPRHWGCFKAIQIDQQDKSVSPISVVVVNQEMVTSQPSLSSEYFDDAKPLMAPGFAQYLNRIQKHYKAVVDEETLRVAKNMASLRPAYKRAFAGKHKSFSPAAVSISESYGFSSQASPMPLEWDWTNVGGVDYVGQVRNQRHCGSCYAFATSEMVESRVRIMTNNKIQPLISTQDIVSCNPYTQGCNGGFGYTVAKYGADFGFIDEKCFPYASTEGQDVPCSQRNRADTCAGYRYWVSDYYYVGGSMEANDEEVMRKELVRNGPFVVSFNVDARFYAYKGGVFVEPILPTNLARLGRLGATAFVPSNHAVLLVGYGVDESGTPFWKVKNSWGPEWGEKGFFRIRRGTDEAGIESCAEAAFVSLAPPQQDSTPELRLAKVRSAFQSALHNVF